MNRELRGMVEGAVAGTVATVPMSAVMLLAGEVGLMGSHPPEVITRKGMRLIGVEPPEEVNEALATAAHMAFGAAAGSLFGVFRRAAKLPLPLPVQGIAYGLLVYTVSYAGWIPAIRILPPPDDDRPGRQPAMVAAHVVYGAVLGALLEWEEAREAERRRGGSDRS